MNVDGRNIHTLDYSEPNGNLLIARIREAATKLNFKPRIMEVCGTHTAVIYEAGIHGLLRHSVELVSGPGCPVCVTPDGIIDMAIGYAMEGCIIASFGDVLKIPGRCGTLQQALARGGDIRIVTSPLSVVEIAVANPGRIIIFLAIGFETTAPGSGLLIEVLEKNKIKNVRLLVAHRLMPPVIRELFKYGDQMISGLICPGHVSTIIGTAPYAEIVKEYRVPFVIAGFTVFQILTAILIIIRQLHQKTGTVTNIYSQVVREEGNLIAVRLIKKIFKTEDAEWRGLGMIPSSGLKLREEYQSYDVFAKTLAAAHPRPGQVNCCCGDILKGKIRPEDCPEFGKQCTPQKPAGPCMVTAEGSCHTVYLNREGEVFRNA